MAKHMDLGIALASVSHPHGLPYLETLQAMDTVGRIYLWDDKAVLDKIESGGKIVRKSSDLEDILDEDGLDGAIVALPPKYQPRTVERILHRGKGVLMEKPGARTGDELLTVVEQAEANKLVLSPCYAARCNPIAVYIKKAIAKGLLGRILSFEARWIASQVRFRNPDLWLFDKTLAGGGILHWLGCHWIDLLRYCLGNEVSQVCCLTGNLNDEQLSVEDTAALALGFEDGALGTLRCGYHLNDGKSGYVGGSYDTLLYVAGTEGYIRWVPKGPQSNILEIRSKYLAQTEAEFMTFPSEDRPGYGGYGAWMFIRQFLEGLAGGGSPAANGRDALQVLRVIDAAYASAKTGKTLTIHY